MKEIPVPADAQARARKKNALVRARKAYNALTFVLALVAILCLIGLLVVVIVLEMRDNSEATEQLLYILTGSFAAGATVLAFAAFFFGKLAQQANLTELDYRERCDGEESFFVGEGTLASFEKDGLRLHAEEGGKKPIFVPYRDMKFYSVCTRRKPRERGDWSVVLEMPSRYVVKEGRGKDAPPRALIQTDGKERLYRTLEARALVLSGEQPPRGEKRENKKFTPRAKFLLPDRARRKKSVVWMVVAGAVAIAGVPIAIIWQDMITIGAILSVFGLFFLGKSIASFVQAKGMIGIYEEGIYWKEGGRATDERIFLKWEEIERVSFEHAQGRRYLKIACAYGNYHLPDVAGAYEYIGEYKPEKVS